MPKERIDARPGYNSDGDEGKGRSVVEVLWGRETGHCQIVSKAVDRFTGDRLSDDEGIHYTDGMYVDLDRRGINNLIRALRRARDQAFGKDE